MRYLLGIAGVRCDVIAGDNGIVTRDQEGHPGREGLQQPPPSVKNDPFIGHVTYLVSLLQWHSTPTTTATLLQQQLSRQSVSLRTAAYLTVSLLQWPQHSEPATRGLHYEDSTSSIRFYTAGQELGVWNGTERNAWVGLLSLTISLAIQCSLPLPLPLRYRRYEDGSVCGSHADIAI
ncbi:hypothetical protein HO173_003400 [Letharia columbiana]|uniref:Uncharacterized protein n=1 Tax=Letharia columbiana TaxID=112416 RepID=A0A8H6L7I8_9LECA|nr:uncharacterized protein HO173_003400 [Letharia columbiana]KAF6238433.1 hypothetical protein HO173_003400 [Letharia columbiana]